MRGKALLRQHNRHTYRITPAHAGKSVLHRAARRQLQDHPRPCGEKSSASMRCFRLRGSPPPMRGKVRAQLINIKCRGITPAHAGKRDTPQASLWPPEDHPRPCGEKRPVLQRARRQQGSPPPMRGKVARRCIIFLSNGITPAHAGKRPPNRKSVQRLQDHPRPCGEKTHA